MAEGRSERARGAAMGLAAAALFGASAPLSKLLLPSSPPLLLAGLLYLGAGLGLSVLAFRPSNEARLRLADAPLLLGVIAAGGVAGPLLMLLGLERLPAITSALLLNLEAPFTVLLAVALFREHLGRGELASTSLIVAGAAVLAYRGGGLPGSWVGALFIAGACLSWAIDNNLTGRLALRDPVALTRAKTLAAGAFSLVLALLIGQRAGSPGQIGAALAVGAISYGLSLVWHTRALRILGAARQAALFATAPFAGAVLSVAILGERPTWTDLAGSALMAVGVVVFLRAGHGHLHTHEPIEHEHLHVHDEHHRHDHDGGSEPHSHLHRHEPLTHEHAHASDVHHRHSHKK